MEPKELNEVVRTENPVIALKLNGSSEPFVRVENIAAMLGIKPRTILDWAHRYPSFPILQLPGSIRVRVSEVNAWLNEFTERARANNHHQKDE
jgi:hypothetical protein